VSAPLFIAGASVRAAAQSAVRAGFVVTAADLFGDRDLTAIAQTRLVEDYPHSIQTIADKLPTTDWLYTGGLENSPDLVDTVSLRHRLLGNPGSVLRPARDPWEWASALQQAGLAFPSPRRERPIDPAGRWLIKPLDSSGGGRIRELRVGTNLSEALEPAECDRGKVDQSACSGIAPAPQGWYFQPWIRGRSLSAVYAAAGGRATLLCVTRQLVGSAWAGSRGFEYVGSVGPLPLPANLQRIYEHIGVLLAERWGLRGLFGVDTVLAANDEVWTIEVNPRYPASVEVWERATDANAVACHRAACDGAITDRHALPVARRVVGKAIVNAPHDVTIDTELDRRLMQLATNGPGPNWADLPLADLPQIGQLIPAGAPVLTVFAEGAEYAATYRLLRARVSQLRATLRRH
jgi:uncharacterized protein